jgi:hypothetical protein
MMATWVRIVFIGASLDMPSILASAKSRQWLLTQILVLLLHPLKLPPVV